MKIYFKSSRKFQFCAVLSAQKEREFHGMSPNDTWIRYTANC